MRTSEGVLSHDEGPDLRNGSGCTRRSEKSNIIVNEQFEGLPKPVNVTKLRDYFVARGYRHVSIQQAAGTGRGEYLDHKAEQPASGTGEKPPS